MFKLSIKKLKLYVVLGAASLSPTIVQAQLDDPTRPPGYRLVLPGGKTAASATRYTVTSIRISASRRVAIVNDKSVEQGDSVNGAKVVEINPSDVKLKKKGKLFSVKLVSQVVKKTRTQ